MVRLEQSDTSEDQEAAWGEAAWAVVAAAAAVEEEEEEEEEEEGSRKLTEAVCQVDLADSGGSSLEEVSEEVVDQTLIPMAGSMGSMTAPETFKRVPLNTIFARTKRTRRISRGTEKEI